MHFVVIVNYMEVVVRPEEAVAALETALVVEALDVSEEFHNGFDRSTAISAVQVILRGVFAVRSMDFEVLLKHLGGAGVERAVPVHALEERSEAGPRQHSVQILRCFVQIRVLKPRAKDRH